MRKIIETDWVELAEMPSVATERTRKIITAYLAPVVAGDEEQYVLARILPPSGREFADLVLCYQITLDIAEIGTRTSLSVQRKLRHALKQVGGLKDLYPNGGLPVNRYPWVIEFMAEREFVQILLGVYENLARQMKSTGTATIGSHKLNQPFPTEGWAKDLWGAISFEHSENPKLGLQIAANFYERLLEMPISKRVVPNDIRYRLAHGVSLLSRNGDRIDDLAVMHAAIVNTISDPCLFYAVETNLAFTRSEDGIKAKVLAKAKKLKLPDGRIVAWDEELVSYRERMRRVYPWYWTRLANAKNDAMVSL